MSWRRSQHNSDSIKISREILREIVRETLLEILEELGSRREHLQGERGTRVDVSHAPVEEVPVDRIEVGVRRRREVGDVQDLARSIEKCGLLNPILISGDYKLICGARRLAAYKLLGRTTIPARRIEGISDEQVWDIELEASIDRWKLNDYEASEQRTARLKQARAQRRAQ